MVVVLEDDLVDSCKSGEDTACIAYVCTTSIFIFPFEMNLSQAGCSQAEGLLNEICSSVMLLFRLGC